MTVDANVKTESGHNDCELQVVRMPVDSRVRTESGQNNRGLAGQNCKWSECLWTAGLGPQSRSSGWVLKVVASWYVAAREVCCCPA